MASNTNRAGTCRGPRSNARTRASRRSSNIPSGAVKCRESLGGALNHYYRDAACARDHRVAKEHGFTAWASLASTAVTLFAMGRHGLCQIVTADGFGSVR